jgi:hypothetical protein
LEKGGGEGFKPVIDENIAGGKSGERDFLLSWVLPSWDRQGV